MEMRVQYFNEKEEVKDFYSVPYELKDLGFKVTEVTEVKLMTKVNILNRPEVDDRHQKQTIRKKEQN